jgi:hypothetical protein
MATAKQIEANQRNALRSTGPATAAGRSISSKNALKHGLTAEEVTVDKEEARKFAAFRDDMIEELGPEGALEEELAQRIATCSWRLRRVLRLEVTDTVHHEESGLGVRVFKGPVYEFMSSGLCQHLIRYEIAIDRSLQRARHDLERLQARRRGEAVAAPIAVDVTHSIDVGVGTGPVVSRRARPIAHEHSNGSASASPAPLVGTQLAERGSSAS